MERVLYAIGYVIGSLIVGLFQAIFFLLSNRPRKTALSLPPGAESIS
jgi:hypothetical protein